MKHTILLLFISTAFACTKSGKISIEVGKDRIFIPSDSCKIVINEQGGGYEIMCRNSVKDIQVVIFTPSNVLDGVYTFDNITKNQIEAKAKLYIGYLGEDLSVQSNENETNAFYITKKGPNKYDLVGTSFLKTSQGIGYCEIDLKNISRKTYYKSDK